MRLISTLAAVTTGAAGLACADAATAQPGADLVQARMIAEHAGAIAGETVRIAVVFEIASEWHLYWRNPGDTGVSPTIDLALPEGVTAGAVQWPTPQRYVHGGGALLDYIHERSLTLVVPLHLDADLEPGSSLAIGADVEWLACREACIPGSATVSFTLPVLGAAATPERAPEASVFDAFDDAAPGAFAAAQEHGVRVSWTGRMLEIVAPGADELVFYPDEPRVGGPVDPIAGCVANGARLVIEYGENAADAGRVTGVLEARGGDAAGRWEITAPAPPAG